MNLRRQIRDKTRDTWLRRRLTDLIGGQKMGPFGEVDEAGVLHITHNAGFFSNCSVALFEVARSERPVTGINASHSFSFYKESPGEDIWGELFGLPGFYRPEGSGEWSRYLLHHSRYSSLRFKKIAPLIENFFSPSEEVVQRVTHFQEKYTIAYDETLAVHYRGTDKWTEIPPRPLDDWVRQVSMRLQKMPSESRILIQTDDEHAFQRFIKEFGHKAFFLDELPRSDGEISVEKLLAPHERLAFAKNLLAMTLILSQCARVVTHTGNVAFWTALFRGSSRNLVQL